MSEINTTLEGINSTLEIESVFWKTRQNKTARQSSKNKKEL